MKKIVAIYGESACGKSAIKKAIMRLRPDYNEVITSTTRPPREGEVDGIDYNYYSEQTMAEKIMKDEMAECVCFRDWVYGTEYSALEDKKINVGIWNPEGVETLNEDANLDCLNIHISSPAKVRIIRSLNREVDPDIEEIIRRYKTDLQDFELFSPGFYYAVIHNDNSKSIEDLAKEVIAKIDRGLGRFV